MHDYHHQLNLYMALASLAVLWTGCGVGDKDPALSDGILGGGSAGEMSVTNAGGGSSGGTTGGPSGGSMDTDTGDDNDSTTWCRSLSVTDPGGNEKLAAAFCVGMRYDIQHDCSHDFEYNFTFCSDPNEGFGYVVDWDGNYGGEVKYGQDQTLGFVWQDTTGAFVIDYEDGAEGECFVNGDVARFCRTR